MATQILRTVDRLRFERPMAVLLAGAAGFAVMAMPQDLLEHGPLGGSLGKAGQGMLAILAAMVCGLVAWLAMRRPTKRVTAVAQDEELDVFEDALPVPRPDIMPAGASVRLRRADRHPDAPAREPIRASRDLGEPFMDVAPSPVAASDVLIEQQPIVVEPTAKQSGLNVAATERPEPETRGPEAADAEMTDIRMAEQKAAQIEPRIEEHADQPATPNESVDITEPAEYASTEAAPLEHVSQEHKPSEHIEPVAAECAARVSEPASLPACAPVASIGRREDSSLAAMIDRLSDGMKARGDATGRPIERDRGPALRDALDELNRLAVRRG